MIIEQHYDDEILVVFLNDEPAARRDAHLSDCSTCRNTLRTLRHLAVALQSEAVWETRELDETPRQSTIDFLRAKQAEMGAASVASRIKKLLSAPQHSWKVITQGDPAWAEQSVIAALVAEAERLIFSTPPVAVALAELASDLSESSADAGTRAAASREYGYALFYTGRYREALAATERAAKAFAGTDRVELARTELQRALIVGEMGDQDQSLLLARAAADTFSALKDSNRYVAARRAEAMALSRCQRYRDALAVYESIRPLAATIGPFAEGGVLQNMAVCYREIEDFDRASQFFFQALDSFERLGQTTAATKTRWNLGRVFIAQGRYRDALRQLRAVQESFREMSMVQDVALATIDIAQVLVLIDEFDDVTNLCRQATEYFRGAGLMETEGALTAIALIQEAATSGGLSPQLILNVRSSVEKQTETRFVQPIM